MSTRNYRMLAIFLVFALLLACAPIAATAATPVPPPTFDPLSINTFIAQTAGAAATQTFVLLPTSTLTPTASKTPTEVPTSTPTFLFVIPTSTVPSSTPTMDALQGPYACKIISQTPEDDTTFAQGASFDMRWQILNSGTNTWDSNSADYRFTGGDKLHKTSAYDFPQSVPAGAAIEFVVPMQAPADPGLYKSKWIIALGKERFCPMSISIVVK